MRLEVLRTQIEFTDDIRVFGQRLLYGHGIQLFLLWILLRACTLPYLLP